MISLVNFVPSVDEGESKREPINQEFGDGIHYLASSQKDLFDILSFSFVGIDEGSLIIDDLEVTNDVSTLGRLIVYRIAVDGFSSLSAVFVLPSSFKAAYAKRKEISGSIASLRNLPNQSIEDKEAKFSALYDVLEKEGASYVLLDGSVKTNHHNKDAIAKVVASKKLPTFLLTYVPQASKSSEPLVVIDEESDFPNYLKKDRATLVFEGIFSLLFSFSLCGSLCLLTGGNVGLGATLLLVSLACLVMALVVIGGVYNGTKKYLQNKKSFIKVQILSAFIVLLSCTIGLLIAYLCRLNDIILPAEGAFGASLAIGLLGTLVLVAFAIFISWPEKIWGKMKKLFRKK